MRSSRPPLVRAFQWDLARQVERLDVLLKLLPRYAEWGYQELYVHLEDAVEYPSLPSVARRDAYSYREFGQLVRAAERVGLKTVPIVNLLGHTQYLIKVPELRDLNELRAPDGSPLERGQVCPLHPRMLEIAAKLIRDMAPFCTAGKMHVGLDESFHLGKCPRCREEIARLGLGGHFAGYVNRLHSLTDSHRLRLGLWADMLNYIPDAIPQLPRTIIAYDWYYYPFRRHPRVELYNYAESDLATPLRAHGIEYWGCPMNGAFRYEPLPLFGDRLDNLRSWWSRCQRVGAAGFLVTSWEAYRLALELTTVVDAAAANFWLTPDATEDNSKLLADGFTRVFGSNQARARAAIALACDRYPFSSYFRWRTNDRWDVTSSSTGERESRVEERHFQRLSSRLDQAPRAFSASVAFRHYLSKRDRFINQNQQAVYVLRDLARRDLTAAFAKKIVQLKAQAQAFGQALSAGRRAARIMWRQSRDPGAASQNETILTQDLQRLKTWKRWLDNVRREPDSVSGSTPVCAAWQLEFTVLHFAPALQKLWVEQQSADGTWETLHSLFLIEFHAAAAQPRSPIEHRWSVPTNHADARAELHFRLGVRGLGQVKVRDFSLFDGTTRVKLRRSKAREILGAPVSKHGFPLPDWNRNADELYLTRPPT